MICSPWNFASYSGFGYGLFMLGNTMNTNKYYFSTDSVSSGGNLSYYEEAGTAMGDETICIIKVGNTNSSSFVPYTNKYSYATDAVSSGHNLSSTNHDASTGTKTFGLFKAGYYYSSGTNYYYSSTTKYLYSSDTTSGGTSLTESGSGSATAGNSTFGVFNIGRNSTNPTRTNKYLYSNDSVSVSTPLSYPGKQNGVVGNSNFGIFVVGGSSPQATEKYIYSNDSVISGANLTGASGLAASNFTLGVLPLSSGSVEKYLFSNDTVSTGTSLLSNTYLGSGATSSPQGVYI